MVIHGDVGLQTMADAEAFILFFFFCPSVFWYLLLLNSEKEEDANVIYSILLGFFLLLLFFLLGRLYLRLPRFFFSFWFHSWEKGVPLCADCVSWLRTGDVWRKITRNDEEMRGGIVQVGGRRKVNLISISWKVSCESLKKEEAHFFFPANYRTLCDRHLIHSVSIVLAGYYA